MTNATTPGAINAIDMFTNDQFTALVAACAESRRLAAEHGEDSSEAIEQARDIHDAAEAAGLEIIDAIDVDCDGQPITHITFTNGMFVYA